jgi:signal transduction histidine kinase
MHNFLENVSVYLIGIVGGALAGYLAISAKFSFLSGYSDFCIILITVLCGIICASIFREQRDIRRLKKYNSLRDESMALITHEMRTSLTSTSWIIQLILQNYRDHLTPEDKKILESTDDSIHVTIMHSINLLDISLINIGKLSLALEWLPLSSVEKLFSDTIEKYALGARRRGISLISHFTLDPKMRVEVDMLRLRIIIENLLENAFQYTSSGGSITLTATNNATTLSISVADSGIGIPASEQGKIFGEFFRATNARRRLSTGSGIGLHMCKQYVTNHHGTISFKSEENKGTTFYITIPLKTSADTKEFLAKL